MTEHFDLGSPADWARRIETYDQHLFSPSLSGPELALVSRVAILGHRTAAEAQQILADERLQRVLAQTWERHSPSQELRNRMSQDPYGRSLLSLAPEADPEPTASRSASRRLIALGSLAESVRVALVPLHEVSGLAWRSASTPAPDTGEAVDDTVTYQAFTRLPDGSAAGITLEKRSSAGGMATYTAFYFNESQEIDLELIVEWSDGTVEAIAFDDQAQDLQVSFTAAGTAGEPVRIAVARATDS